MKSVAVLLVSALAATSALNYEQSMALVPQEWKTFASFFPESAVTSFAGAFQRAASKRSMTVEQLFHNAVEPALLAHPSSVQYLASQKRQSTNSGGFDFDFDFLDEGGNFTCTGEQSQGSCQRDKCIKPVPELDDGKCDWYNDKACCTRQSATLMHGIMQTSMNTVGIDPEGDCADHFFLMVCGMLCSPDPNSFQGNAGVFSGEPKICKGFCESMFDACKDQQVMGMPFIPADTTKEQCASLPESNCFNGASALSASLALIVLTALASMIVFF